VVENPVYFVTLPLTPLGAKEKGYEAGEDIFRTLFLLLLYDKWKQ
jgi:hypothetical protein